jgi:O-antigen/teichoic acid export membrane protein
MQRRLFLIDNAVVLVAQVMSKLRGIVTLPLLVKGLGGEAYGTWSQLLSFSTLAAALFSLNLHVPLLRFLRPERNESARAYLTLLLASTAISIALGLTLLASLGNGVIPLLVGRPDRELLALALALAVTSGIRNLNLNYYRAASKLLIRSAIDLLGNVLELAAVIAVLSLGYGLHAALGVLVVSGLAIAVVSSLLILRATGLAAPSWATFREALAFSAPLLPATICMWVLDRSDRFILAHFLDQFAVGTYSAQYALATLLTFAQVPLQMTLIPRVAQAWDQQRGEALDLLALALRLYLGTSLPFVIAAPLLAGPAISILASPAMAAGAGLNVLLIGIGLTAWGLSNLVSSVLYGAKQTRLVSRATVLGALVNVVLNVLLIPRFGIVAAAAATAVTYILTLIAFVGSARAFARVRYPFADATRAAVAAIVAATPLWFIAPSTVVGILASGVLFLAGYLACLYALGVRRSTFRMRD